MNLVYKYLIVHKMARYYKEGDECPLCGENCDDQSEYVDVGPGWVPVTYDMSCWNCGAEGHNSGTEVRWYVPDPDSPYGVSALYGPAI